jgi:hypothetical protein
MIHCIDIVSHGIPFRVVYGPLEDFAEHGTTLYDGEPQVAFYDRRYPHTEHGQHITHYGAESILHPKWPGFALSLYGGEPDWYIDWQRMSIIRVWLEQCVS